MRKNKKFKMKTDDQEEEWDKTNTKTAIEPLDLCKKDLFHNIPASQAAGNKELFLVVLFLPSISSQAGPFQALVYDIQQLQPKNRHKQNFRN